MKYRCPDCGEETYSDDTTIVERFNELVRTGKIDYKTSKFDGNVWVPFENDVLHRLRPTPRYRAFTPVEAAGHLSRVVRFKNDSVDTIADEWHIAPKCILLVFGNTVYPVSYEEAVRQVIFTDINEPFGVRL
jgi:hypothetical protein